MDTFEVWITLEPAEPDRVAAAIPALPGVLVLGGSVDEVLERAQAAIEFHVGRKGQIAIVPQGVVRLAEAA